MLRKHGGENTSIGKACRQRPGRSRAGAQVDKAGNGAELHGAGPCWAGAGRSEPESDGAKPRSDADPHGAGPTAGRPALADQSSSSAAAAAAAAAAATCQQVASLGRAESRPARRKPGRSRTSGGPDPARADISESDGAEHAADMHGPDPRPPSSVEKASSLSESCSDSC